MLDLPYVEDSRAEVDMNVVMLRPIAGGEAQFVEVQGTAEGAGVQPIASSTPCLALAEGGLLEIADVQAAVIADAAVAASGSMITLVCASANPDKVAEIQQLLAGVVDLLPRPADDRRRRGGCRHTRRQRAVEGDGDHGGDRSAGRRRRHRAGGRCPRWRARASTPPATPGRAAATPTTGRRCSPSSTAWTIGRAAFKTVAMIVWPDGSELAVEGVCPGTIADEDRGTIGFGYDAIFVPDEGDGRTFAEMGPEAKNELSHRGRAFRALLSELARR